MKHISNEEFFNQLNSCEYGRQYIELVTNPKNHLGKKEKGENHHIHPKKLGGDLKAKNNLVRLSYFNHCLAHVLLCKAAMQLHCNWVGETKMMLLRLGAVEFRHLSELEQFTLEDVYNWSELRAEGHKESGRKIHERYSNMTDEDKEAYKKRMKEIMSNDEVREKLSKSQLKRFKDPNEHIKTSEASKKAMANMSEETKAESVRKIKEARDNWSDEYKEELHNKLSIIQTEIHSRPEIIENQSNKMIEKWSDEEYRSRLKVICKEAQNRPEVIQKQREVQLIAQNRPETRAKRKESLAKICSTQEWSDIQSKAQREAQNRPEVKAKKSAVMQGKNVGKIKIINENEPKYKMVFPKDLPYWESLGWHKKSA